MGGPMQPQAVVQWQAMPAFAPFPTAVGQPHPPPAFFQPPNYPPSGYFVQGSAHGGTARAQTMPPSPNATRGARPPPFFQQYSLPNVRRPSGGDHSSQVVGGSFPLQQPEAGPSRRRRLDAGSPRK